MVRVTDQEQVLKLREALDTLWGAIPYEVLKELDRETVEVAKSNHYTLWHSGE